MDKIKELELRLALVSDELINTQADLDNERQYQVSMEYLWALDRELLSNLKEHSENAEPKLANAVEALRDMCAEFRAYDLPYGSKAYLKAATVLNEIDKQ